jgi:hypothetical protein
MFLAMSEYSRIEAQLAAAEAERAKGRTSANANAITRSEMQALSDMVVRRYGAETATALTERNIKPTHRIGQLGGWLVTCSRVVTNGEMTRGMHNGVNATIITTHRGVALTAAGDLHVYEDAGKAKTDYYEYEQQRPEAGSHSVSPTAAYLREPLANRGVVSRDQLLPLDRIDPAITDDAAQPLVLSWERVP